jgi:hypothetical protein
MPDSDLGQDRNYSDWFSSVPPVKCQSKYHGWGYNHLLPHTFQFIIHKSSFHSMLYSLGYWQCHLMNHKFGAVCTLNSISLRSCSFSPLTHLSVICHHIENGMVIVSFMCMHIYVICKTEQWNILRKLCSCCKYCCKIGDIYVACIYMLPPALLCCGFVMFWYVTVQLKK